MHWPGNPPTKPLGLPASEPHLPLKRGRHCCLARVCGQHRGAHGAAQRAHHGGEPAMEALGRQGETVHWRRHHHRDGAARGRERPEVHKGT